MINKTNKRQVIQKNRMIFDLKRKSRRKKVVITGTKTKKLTVSVENIVLENCIKLNKIFNKEISILADRIETPKTRYCILFRDP